MQRHLAAPGELMRKINGAEAPEDGRPSRPVTTQRWRDGSSRFVPPDAVFDPSGHGVEEIRREDAARLLAEHHYLSTCPVAVKAYGLYHKSGVSPATLVGCAVFGMPASQATVTVRTGLPADAGLELTRFVAIDSVAFNGESYFIARALKALAAARPSLVAIIAHSDPTPRIDRNGRWSHRGHIGQIYQASNALYLGRARARWMHIAADGAVLPDRLFSKIRRGGIGADGAERRLVGMGAPERPRYLDRTTWLAQALTCGAFTRALHPGVHAYVLPVGSQARRTLARTIETHPAPRALDLPMAA